jgi:hypothetical protein
MQLTNGGTAAVPGARTIPLVDGRPRFFRSGTRGRQSGKNYRVPLILPLSSEEVLPFMPADPEILLPHSDLSPILVIVETDAHFSHMAPGGR